MGNNKITILVMVAALALIVVSQSLFSVDQRAQAIVLQLGQPIGEPREPGLHFKIPLVQEVRYFDRRILPVDPTPKQMVISSSLIEKRDSGAPESEVPENEAEAASTETAPEAASKETATSIIEDVSGEPIIVDTFARYKIIDPLQFLKTLSSIDRANARLENILEDATRTVMGVTTLRELLSSKRQNVMESIRARVNRKIKQDKLGIEIVDVRIVRADLTHDLRDSTVRRMISELKERATETRSKGEERGLEIRSTADKERVVILANSARDAQIIRGEGDKESIRIYADAFNKDKEFYGFIRSMEAYKKTLADPDTQLVLSPDSEFFKYFGAK
ncbi:MAG: protease modulator HflC [Rhodospirillales bacterium]|nr:protease modulator HflC [Alphaproteobacteria bacterium]USO03845.1 MAG: protease modulator HflC [Rhodospirillales bacterium]